MIAQFGINVFFLGTAVEQAPHVSGGMTTPEAAFLVGLLNLIGVLVVAIIGFMTRRHAKNADKAVNRTPPGTPRLVEMVSHVHEQVMGLREHIHELLEWKRSYEKSPWRDGDGVRKWLHEHSMRQQEIKVRVEHIERHFQEMASISLKGSAD